MRITVGDVAFRWILRLQDKAIFENQDIHFRRPETTQGIFRRADNRLTADVKARIHQNRTTGLLLKLRQQTMQPRVSNLINGLQPRRVVNMCDGRNL